MQTPSERKFQHMPKWQQIKFVRGMNKLRRDENVRRGGIKNSLLAESENLVIKPGMKLVYDEELNRMVWR